MLKDIRGSTKITSVSRTILILSAIPIFMYVGDICSSFHLMSRLVHLLLDFTGNPLPSKTHTSTPTITQLRLIDNFKLPSRVKCRGAAQDGISWNFSKITISVLAEFFGFRSGSEATKQFCGLIKESEHVDAWLEYRETIQM
jgi:hypothetical protein